MRAGVTFTHAMRVLARGAFPGHCPNCEQHSMFRDFYTLYDQCPRCGVRYERESGAWLGAVALGYGVGALVVVLLGLVELSWHPLAGLGVHPLWTIVIVGLVVTAFAYRPAKGAWFALLWLYEFTDEPTEPLEEGSREQSAPR